MFSAISLSSSNFDSQLVAHKNLAVTVFVVTFVASGILLGLSFHLSNFTPPVLRPIFAVTVGLSLLDLILTMRKKTPLPEPVKTIPTSSTPPLASSNAPISPSPIANRSSSSPLTSSSASTSLSNLSTTSSSATPIANSTDLSFQDAASSTASPSIYASSSASSSTTPSHSSLVTLLKHFAASPEKRVVLKTTSLTPAYFQEFSEIAVFPSTYKIGNSWLATAILNRDVEALTWIMGNPLCRSADLKNNILLAVQQNFPEALNIMSSKLPDGLQGFFRGDAELGRLFEQAVTNGARDSLNFLYSYPFRGVAPDLSNLLARAMAISNPDQRMAFMTYLIDDRDILNVNVTSANTINLIIHDKYNIRSDAKIFLIDKINNVAVDTQASFSQDLVVIEYLVSKNRFQNGISSYFNNRNPLMHALRTEGIRHYELIELLSTHCIVSARDVTEQTVIHHYACQAFSSLDILNILSRTNKELVDMTDANGNAPLRMALQLGHWDVAHDLLDVGAQIDEDYLAIAKQGYNSQNASRNWRYDYSSQDRVYQQLIQRLKKPEEMASGSSSSSSSKGPSSISSSLRVPNPPLAASTSSATIMGTTPSMVSISSATTINSSSSSSSSIPTTNSSNSPSSTMTAIMSSMSSPIPSPLPKTAPAIHMGTSTSMTTSATSTTSSSSTSSNDTYPNDLFAAVDSSEFSDHQNIDRLASQHDLSMRDSIGNTVLHYGIANDNLEPLKILLSNKDISKIIDLANHDQQTPLYQALTESPPKFDAANLLINAGANFNLAYTTMNISLKMMITRINSRCNKNPQLKEVLLDFLLNCRVDCIKDLYGNSITPQQIIDVLKKNNSDKSNKLIEKLQQFYNV